MRRWWLRWGPASGLIVVVLWAPMGLLIPHLPDLGSSAEIERFYRVHAELLKVVTLLTSVGYLPLLAFLGLLVELLRRAEGPGPLAWIAFGSGLMFMTSLNIAVGLAATAGLLSGVVSPEAVGALHRAAFVLAAPVAPAGVAFFAATSALAFSTDVLPRWLAWVGAIASVANLGALGGIFSLTGPLNSGNGVVGGIAAPIASWLAWILLASLWLMNHGRIISSSADPPGY